MTKTLEFRWTVSRGRDTYGYNICSLYVNGDRASRCNGGGYDMKGTALGDYIAKAYADRLMKLKPEDMPAQGHWQPDYNTFVCRACMNERINRGLEYITLKLPGDDRTPPETWPKCPNCSAEMDRDHYAGERIEDGRYFYGLTYHDPKFDPGKAVLDHPPVFGTEADKGKTVAELEAESKSLGLERYQEFYHASSKHPTARHVVPLIDGACGFSSVEKIMSAIGLSLQWVQQRRNAKNDLYILHDKQDEQTEAA
jgi:hypothetical protein